jgi:predicted SAM-dependent methyltransferase
MAVRINIGCGQTPTRGWRNFDSSLSLRLSKIPLLPALLLKMKVLDRPQYQFIRFARDNGIEFADATKRLPLRDESVDVLYSSYMLEHVDTHEAGEFFKKALRVLRPGGIIRIAVPDIRKLVEGYLASADADAFMQATYLCMPRPKSFAQRLRLLLVGFRNHQWMYDGKSLSSLLHRHGFVKTEMMPVGQTRISGYEPLDLQERASESAYVEAEKPTN